VLFDVGDQIVDQFLCLLPRRCGFRIAVAFIAEVGAVEGQIDVLRESADRVVALRERGAPLEDEPRRILALDAENVNKRPRVTPSPLGRSIA
jgi:hypothetical protein